MLWIEFKFKNFQSWTKLQSLIALLKLDALIEKLQLI